MVLSLTIIGKAIRELKLFCNAISFQSCINTSFDISLIAIGIPLRKDVAVGPLPFGLLTSIVKPPTFSR